MDADKLISQLQIQRNQFADAHAVAAARAETLADELEKLRVQNFELNHQIGVLNNGITELNARIAELEARIAVPVEDDRRYDETRAYYDQQADYAIEGYRHPDEA